MKKNEILLLVFCVQIVQIEASVVKRIVSITSKYATSSKNLLEKYKKEFGLQNKIDSAKAEIVDTQEKIRPRIEEFKKKYGFDVATDSSIKKDTSDQKTSIHVHVDGKGGHGLWNGGQSHPSINPGQTNNYYYGRTNFWDVLEKTGTKGIALFSATAGGLAVWILKPNNVVVPDKIILIQENKNS